MSRRFASFLLSSYSATPLSSRLIATSTTNNALPRLDPTPAPLALPGRPWQLFAAVLLERPPIVGKKRTDLEEDFQLMLDDYEDEKALKSDHEIRVERDIFVQEQRRKGEEVLTDSLQTGLDYEEQREKLLTRFCPASRESESDDVQSLRRKLDEKLYLFVPSSLDERVWILPADPIEGDATLREVAESALCKIFGSAEKVNDKIQMMGNAPFGFYKYIYPAKSESASQFRGAKFFVLKAFLKDPRTFEMKVAKDRSFKWLTKDEMNIHLHPRLTSKLQSCCFDY